LRVEVDRCPQLALFEVFGVKTMATFPRKCCTTFLAVAGLWLLTIVLAADAGDVNYRDVIVDRKSNYMSRYFRRLYRRQRHCDEPGLAERVHVADVILTGTIRALEDDLQRPGAEIARVEVKRIIKDYGQVYIFMSYADIGPLNI